MQLTERSTGGWVETYGSMKAFYHVHGMNAASGITFGKKAAGSH